MSDHAHMIQCIRVLVVRKTPHTEPTCYVWVSLGPPPCYAASTTDHDLHLWLRWFKLMRDRLVTRRAALGCLTSATVGWWSVHHITAKAGKFHWLWSLNCSEPEIPVFPQRKRIGAAAQVSDSETTTRRAVSTVCRNSAGACWQSLPQLDCRTERDSPAFSRSGTEVLAQRITSWRSNRHGHVTWRRTSNFTHPGYGLRSRMQLWNMIPTLQQPN